MTDGTIDAEMTNAMAAEMTSEISDRRREESWDRRINTADYVVEELYGSTGHTEAGRGQLSRDVELYDSEDSDGYSAHGQNEDAESEDDTDYVDAGFTSDRSDSARTPRSSARSFRGPTEGRDRRDTSRERQQYGPCAACGGMGHSAHFCRRHCKFCKQVHEVGQCELFRRYEKLASFVKNNVDKSKVPEELQDLYTPKPVVEANFVFAFVGEAGWPEGSVGTDEGICDSDGNERESEESDEDDSAMVSAAATRWYDSVTQRPRVVKLLRGERLGWWSSQKFDRRVRMRALVMGATRQDIAGHWSKRLGGELILGTDFMIPAGIRLDLYNSAAKLPGEVVVPLLRTLKDTDDQTYGLQTADGPTEAICLSDRATAE
ncbi:hypothetical protein PHPALM_29614 [Phytophthora palmivora]|uniref:Eukaryotic/viral aspartic protease n=1 Tax=Phytophthora palmivora TaxID=4796 RepID=A0A2P4X744_9STRA|nr:hypothetical protein PHPALM_29614 [Phytophthora palmivora]